MSRLPLPVIGVLFTAAVVLPGWGKGLAIENTQNNGDTQTQSQTEPIEVAGKASSWEDKHTRLANQYLSLLLGDPSYGHIVDLLWVLYEKNADTELLLSNVQAQALANSEFPQPSRILGHLYRKSGDLLAAGEAYERALEIDSEHYGVFFDLAEIAAVAGDPKARREALQQLLEVPTLPVDERVRALVDLGHAEVAAGDRAAAASAWGDALEVAPGAADLRRELARAMLSAGLTDEALAEFAKLAEVDDPQVRIGALAELARLQEHAGEFDAAAETLQQGMAGTHFEDYRHAAFFDHLLRIYERQDRLAELETALLVGVEEGAAGDPRKVVPLIRFYRETVQFEECEKWLRDLVARPGSDPRYRAELVEVLLVNGSDEEAGRELDQLLNEGGAVSAELVFQRCAIDFRLGNPEEAEVRLRGLLTTAPDDRELSNRVLNFARENFLGELSEELLADALVREPGSGDAAFAIASYAFERGRDERARATVESFLAGAEKGSQASLGRLRDMASRLLATDRYEFALEIAARAAEHSGAGRDDRLLLADVRSGLGMRDEAMADLEHAWLLSENFAARVDVDERVLSLLENDAARKDSEEELVEDADARMPPSAKGKGDPQLNVVPSLDFQTQWEMSKERMGLEGLRENLRGMASAFSRRFAKSIADRAKEDPSREKQMRAAWWATRVGDHAAAYELFAELRFDESGNPLTLPLEIERMLLDLAVETGNESLEGQQVQRLLALDAEGSFEYRKRAALLEIRRRFVEKGLAELRLLLDEDPSDLALLSSYAQVLRDRGREEEAEAAWAKAFDRARPQEISLVGERFARLLVERGEYGRAAKVLARAMKEESDVGRRKDLAAKQAAFIDLAVQQEEEGRFLQALEQEYRGLVQNDPLDPLFHQVLAEIYRASEDPLAAFGAMRQAHYLAPDDPSELPALRDAALEAGDREAAIYFQRQLLFGRGGGSDLKQWRSLISMLEEELRVDEADGIRARLERQFSQDPALLSEMAEGYEKAGRMADGARVRERLAALRPWDLRERFLHALGAVRAGNREMATKILDQLIEELASERLSGLILPIQNERSDLPGGATEIGDAVAETATMKDGDFEAVYGWLGEPHPEFTKAPSEAGLLRLRSIGERARIFHEMGESRGSGADALLAKLVDRPIERLWAATYLRRGSEAMAAFETLVESVGDGDESAAKARNGFCRCLLGLRLQEVRSVLDWVALGADDPQLDQSRRVRIFLAAFEVLTQGGERWRPDENGLQVLGQHPAFTTDQRWELVRDLGGASAYREAVAMGDGVLLQSGEFVPNRAYILAIYANMTGSRKQEIRFLRQALNQTVDGIRRTQENLFYEAFVRLYRALPSVEEKKTLLAEVEEGFESIGNPQEVTMRRTYVAAVAGESEDAREFLREFYEKVEERGMPGGWSVTNHFSLSNRREPVWEQLLNHAEFLKNHQLAPLALEALAHGEEILESEALHNEEAVFRYNDLKRAGVVWELRELNYQQRIASILLHTAGMESAGELKELASRLEVAGYHRERAFLFRELLRRAASNSDYAEQFLEACLIARDHEPALAYLNELKNSPPSNRPQGLTPDRQDQLEAKFVRMAGDLEGLRREGDRRDPQPDEINPERPPREVYFLSELAGCLEERGDFAGAAEAYVKQGDYWLPKDGDVRLNAASAFGAAGNHGAAVAQLRFVLGGKPPEDVEIDVIIALAEHLGELSDWEGVRDLLPRAASFRDPGPTLALTGALLKGGFHSEVRSALLLAERRNRDDLSLIRVLSALLEVSLQPEMATRDEGELVRIFRELSLLDLTEEEPLAHLVEVLISGGDSLSPFVLESILQAAEEGGASGAMAGVCAVAISQKDSPKGRELRDAGIAALGEAQDFSWARSRVAIETLLKKEDAESALRLWRRHEMLVPSRRSLRPLHVEIFAALGDESAMESAHAEGARAFFPGAPFGTELPGALAKAGKVDLALDLFANYELQLRRAGRNYPAFVEEYIELLIDTGSFSHAEYLLLREHHRMPRAAPRLLVALYSEWGKTSEFDDELTKFHLASGVRSEVDFRMAAVLAKKEEN